MDWLHKQILVIFNTGFSLNPFFESHEGNRSLCLYLSIYTTLKSSSIFLRWSFNPRLVWWGSDYAGETATPTAVLNENITVFMPPTVPDEFSLRHQNLLLAATLVQAFRLPFSSLTWAGPCILRKWRVYGFHIQHITWQYFIAKPTLSDPDNLPVL